MLRSAASRSVPQVRSAADRTGIAPNVLPRAVMTLSGGNQQKAILGRWLCREPKLLILDEPTQGIDVGTKAQIYKLIMALACEGRGILLISSELFELANLADRILVVRDGRLEGLISSADVAAWLDRYQQLH